MQYLTAAVGGNLEDRFAAPRDQWSKLDRFLILGSDSNTYYTGVRKLTPELAGPVRACLAEDGLRVVSAISQIAASGRAPKLDAALFGLAMAASPNFAEPATNAAALELLPVIARTTAQLEKFAASVTRLRGWGRSLRSAIARWYLEKPAHELARQMLKRRERGRWSHADLLRLSHPKPVTKAQRMLFRWAVEGELGCVPADLLTADLKQVYAFEQAKKATDRGEVVRLIEDYQLTHEMLPQRWLEIPEVWEALLETMPYCAILRHLGKLTAVGLIAEYGATTALVAARLVDRSRIARAKANPVTLLSAWLDYRQDGGVPAVAGALEEAYYISFENLQPCGHPVHVTTDGAAPVASAVMAMIAARMETDATIVPGIDRNTRLRAVLSRLEESGTDGRVVVKGNGRTVTIAANSTEAPQPELYDGDVLQIVGFDATVPAVAADFIRAC